MLIVAPCDDDEVLSQCSALSDQETGSLCSDTEALSVDDEANHRVVGPGLVLPRSCTSSCTCKGVGADGRTRQERCSLQMPQRSSLRSSSASSSNASGDGSSSCGMRSSKSARSVTFSDELQVTSRTRPMPWARCPACAEAARLDPAKDQVQDEFSWWGLLSFSSSWTGGSDRDQQQQQQQQQQQPQLRPGRHGNGAKAPEAPNEYLNGNMKEQQQQDPFIKAAPVRTFKLHIDCAPQEFSITSSEAPRPSTTPPPAAPCARPPHQHHHLQKHQAAAGMSNGGRVRGRMTMSVLGSLAEGLAAHQKGADDRSSKIRRRSKTAMFL